MAAQTIINLLVVDRALTDIEKIVQALRLAGYVVQSQSTDELEVVEDALKDTPAPDLVMVRIAQDLPQLRSVSQMLSKLPIAPPLLAVVDDYTNAPITSLLRHGADNVVPVNKDEHIILVASHELRMFNARRSGAKSEERLKELETRSRVLLDSSRDAIAYIHEGAHIYANPAYLRLFGYESEADLEGITLINMVVKADRDKLKSYLRKSTRDNKLQNPIELTGLHSNNSTTFPITLTCLPTRINDEPSLQIMIQTASSKDGEAHLAVLNRYDVSTGLFNRKYFIETLNTTRSSAANNQIAGAVLYILLTDYRANNEQFGLEAVDELIIGLANVLKTHVSEQDMVAHFSDAVFAVFTPSTDKAQINALAEQLRDAVRDHVTHAAQKLVSTRCAIGICLVQGDYDSAFQIVANADRACEKARQAGPNQIQLYEPPAKNDGETPEQRALLEQIKAALERERLELWFQPIVSFQGGSDERYKTYLHVLDEQHRPLALHDQMSLLLRKGLMYPLEKWEIIKVLEMLTGRYQQKRSVPSLYVRISDNTVSAPDFIPWLTQRLRDTGLPGQVLTLELHEELVEHFFKEARVLRDKLGELGCLVAIGHFGGRQNSERILRHIKPDYIKLDGSFIEKVAKSKDADLRESMAKLTQLAQEMGVQVVAAEVSNATQMASIWQYGVSLVQGNMIQEAGREMNFDFKQFMA